MSGARDLASQRNQIPSTGRMPNFLARQYGYDSAKRFADSLPKSAVVIDVGAGLSRLGHYVAKARPDVRWVNADLVYSNPQLLAVVSKDAPKNLEFIGGDVIAFSPELHTLKGKADRVFSYWMMPHLSLHNMRLAEQAAGTMWELLSDDGVLAIGPIRSGWWYYKHSLRFTKRTPKGDAARVIARATKLHWLPRKVQALGNRYNVHIASKLLALWHRWQQRKPTDATK